MLEISMQKNSSFPFVLNFLKNHNFGFEFIKQKKKKVLANYDHKRDPYIKINE